jgi:hypothetical protein
MVALVAISVSERSHIGSYPGVRWLMMGIAEVIMSWVEREGQSVDETIGNGESTWCTLLAELSPVVTEALLLPGDDGSKHEFQCLLPARPKTGQPDPEESIGGSQLRQLERRCLGHKPEPSAGSMDSQTIKASS